MFDIGQLTGKPVPERIKKPRVNSKNHAEHQTAYRDRRKLGLVPVEKPWQWLSRFELIELVWSAYKVSTWYSRDDAIEPMEHQTARELREAWVDELAKCFKDALYAYAAERGQCWFEDDGVAQCARYVEVWKSLQGEVDPGWRPQYPLYKKLAPAERCSAPGALTSADEGSANDRDSTH